MHRVPPLPREQRMAYYHGFALACILVSTAFTAAGFYLLHAIPPLFGAALLFVSPLYFLIAVMRGARGRLDWAALALGLVLTPFAVAYIGGGLDLLAVGLVGGTAAYLFHKARGR